MKKDLVSWGISLGYCFAIISLLTVVHGWHYINYNDTSISPSELIEKEDLLKEKGWTVVHILGEGCGCSEFVSEYLEKRGPASVASEYVYFLGNKKGLKEDLPGKGFKTKFFEFNDLLKRNVEMSGVPFFQLYNEKNELVYSGGYSDKMITRTSKYDDLTIISKYQKGSENKSLPIFGCAVSKEFQSKIDPIGFKY